MFIKEKLMQDGFKELDQMIASYFLKEDFIHYSCL